MGVKAITALSAIKAAGRILALLLTFAMVGAGVGFLLGEITMRTSDRTAQVSFAEGSADVGALVAMIVGSIVYFILRPRILIGEFSAIVVSAFAIGALAALPGWEIIVPMAAVAGTIGAALVIYALRGDE